MVHLAVYRRHEIRPRGDVVLEGVPHVRSLLDVVDVGRDRCKAGVHGGEAALDAGQVLLSKLVKLVWGKKYSIA